MSARDLSAVFPPAPASVPPGLTEPSKSYQRHAWLALGGLLAFVALYLGLTGYLAWMVWRLVGNALLHGGNVIVAGLLSIPALFFLAFLVRGLFVVKHSADPTLVELDPSKQPTLFAFIMKLADDTGAPRPHKVFLSGRVNAAVFYDLSFWNLLFPSKKNLELGLGLINALTLDELKAVVAHEYGHFAQKTMAVGRWVYIAQQIAGHIVMSRSVFDRFLQGVSRIDLRIAWIGWIGRLFVWAIRAVLDTGFRLVLLAHRALGREMEFNADRVAVAVSGSDSLVHALHRLGPADEAWEEAASFASEELSAGRDVDDLFVLQTAALEHLRRIFDEPHFGQTPQRPEADATFRVFDAKLAQPPRMWMTHPPNREREDSAKAVYVPSPLDGRPAWTLFADAEAVRREVTAKLLEPAKLRRAENPPSANPPAPAGTALERFATRFSRPALDPRYRGVYLGRSITAFHDSARALIGDVPRLEAGDVRRALDQLYPDTLRHQLASYRERREEEALLEGLQDGVLTAPGGVIRYRGRELRRKELPRVLDSVRTERKDIEQRILDHDRACRATHLAAANLIGHGWAEHLKGLVALLHYAGQSLRNLGDAHGHLHHVLGIVLADGNVSNAERQRVLKSADDLYFAMTSVWANQKALTLPSDIAERFEDAGGFTALREDLGLNQANEQNLGDWLKVMEGWAQGAIGDLKVLADVTLDRLLEVEGDVARWATEGGDIPDAPAAAVLPAKYGTCVVGQERERQKKLGWWDRFQTADGVVPGALRAAVASGVLLPALFIGGHVGSSTVHVVNGLDTPVVVTFEGKKHVVPAHGSDRFDVEPSGQAHVETRTLDGATVDSFDVEVGGGFSHAIYNVGQAVPLIEWTAVYGAGAGSDSPDRPIGATRWMDAPQDYVFQTPPTSMSLKRGQTARKRVVEALHAMSPPGQLRAVTDEATRQAMLTSHLRFDPSTSERFAAWVDLALDQPALRPVLLERAASNPKDVMLQRLAMEVEDAREQVCARVRTQHEAAPKEGDFTYLHLRCERASTATFLEAWEAHRDNPWLSWAVAGELAAAGRWKDGVDAMAHALSAKALAAMKPSGQLEYVRLVRSAGGAVKENAALLNAAEGSPLAFLRRIEGGGQKDDWEVPRAWRALLKGQLDQALREANASKDPGLAARMKVLVGASDGATKAQVEAAMRALEGPSVDQWLKVAMQVRAGQLVERPGALVPGVSSPAAHEAVLAALTDRTLARTPQRLEAALEGFDVRQRAIVFAMGTLVLGAQAPATWRRAAKDGLFIFERPYFR
jgi:Zn-dependent protease with chaperone function